MNDTPDLILDRILAGWPRLADMVSARDVASMLERWGIRNTSDVRGTWLRPLSRFERGSGVRINFPHAETARFVVFDSADTTAPAAIATFIRNEDGWMFEGLDARCPSCLATGFLPEDGTLCATCGGVGWGVASGEAIPAPEPIPA